MQLRRADYALVIGLFVVSRILYALLGLHFDSSPFPGYMQFIDSELLRTRLLESLWYYHAHPPLLNLFTGIGLKLFGEHADAFFAVSFHALGVAMALAVYALTLRLTSARVAAAIATGLLVFSPSFVLYENWLMYSFPAAALLTIAALLLHQYVTTKRTRTALVFFAVLATLLLTRSIFHLAWMVLVVALLAVAMRGYWRQILLAAALPVFVVVFWYGKNYHYFGSFSASTAMGLGLSNITTLLLPREQLAPLVEQGRLSKYALVSRYDQTELLFRMEPPRHTGIPVLDEVTKTGGAYNFNNVQLVEVNKRFTADAIEVARTFPASYVLGLVVSNRLFFSPSNMNLYFDDQNRRAVRPMEKLFNPLLYGVGAQPRYMAQPHFGFVKNNEIEVNTSVPLIVAWCLLLGYGYVRARRGILAPDDHRGADAIAVGFIILSAAYLYVVATAVELGENYRYRFLIEPLFMVLAVAALTDLFRKVRSRFGKSA
ncbi:MAG TPA: glycosyltransferase family 39 protein [Steroidobacteraceae bacterium]|nr:glycosyltransferase family 39 protein [Steroidobacteraceae bacterium]